MRTLTLAQESWPIAGSFTISRGSKTAADVIVVTLTEDGFVGRGEAVPYPRYNETLHEALVALEEQRTMIESGAAHDICTQLIIPRAARNALDCAFWDLAAKKSGKPAWQLAELPAPHTIVTAFTISLGTVAASSLTPMRAGPRIFCPPCWPYATRLAWNW
jgi:L-Ala-D/L-Glu epimerase